MSENPTQYEVDGWLAEKSENIFKELGIVVDLVKQFEQELPEDFESRLLSMIGTSLWDVTKILSSAYGDNRRWSPNDRDMIMENGSDACKVILARYKGRNIEFITDFNHFKKEFEALLKGPSYPNRTLINDLFGKCVVNDPRISTIRNFTEKVNMGEIEWSEYITLVKLVLSPIDSGEDA